jgi:hypothetical protein
MPALPWTTAHAADPAGDEVVVMASLLQLDSFVRVPGLLRAAMGNPPAGARCRWRPRRGAQHCAAAADVLHSLGLEGSWCTERLRSLRAPWEFDASLSPGDGRLPLHVLGRRGRQSAALVVGRATPPE